MNVKYFLYIALLLPCSLRSFAQDFPIDDGALSVKYPFVNTVFNRIQTNSGLDSFYSKLAALKQNGTGVVTVVHIGDSHIQAGFLSGVVREGLQSFFGNAGRGLIFPYQLAESNAPDDIVSSSNTRWQFNRVAHPELTVTPGIAGFGIESTSPGASIYISLKQSNKTDPAFNHVQFFSNNTDWSFRSDFGDSTYIVPVLNGIGLIQLSKPATGFTLINTSENHNASFFGASLENGQPGIIYHTIGVNGARYDQYNLASLFWEQLPALKADLYIVSLGTNEAQRASFAETLFLQEFTAFLSKLQQISPGAAVLITTSPDTYKARRSNVVLKQLNQSLVGYCNKNRIPVWDLYQVTNGFGSAYNWARRGLMSRDRVHFTAEGYRIQGALLLNALGKGYNQR